MEQKPDTPVGALQDADLDQVVGGGSKWNVFMADVFNEPHDVVAKRGDTRIDAFNEPHDITN